MPPRAGKLASTLAPAINMPRLRDEKDLECTWRLERHAHSRGFTLVAGCDEAGRGAMIGPLTAAAVILDPARPIPGLNDSKKLTPQVREELARRICNESISYKVIFISAEDVDRLNVYQASRVAMIRALHALAPAPQYILTDAMRLWSDLSSPEVIAPFRCLIHGDARSASIAAASILAKVARDAHMREPRPAIPSVRPRPKQRLLHAAPSEESQAARPLRRTPQNLSARQRLCENSGKNAVAAASSPPKIEKQKPAAKTPPLQTHTEMRTEAHSTVFSRSAGGSSFSSVVNTPFVQPNPITF